MKQAVVLNMGDLQKQADLIIETAQQKAGEIVKKAELQSQQLADQVHAESEKIGHAKGFKQGHEEGLEQGHQQAYKDAAEKIDNICKQWQHGATQWESDLQKIHQLAHQAVLDTAVNMARKVVHRIVDVDNTVITDQLAEVLAHILRPIDASVRICPDDRPVLDETIGDLLTQFHQLKHVHLIEDPAITAGGCVVSFGQGQIDATIEKQLQRVIEAMIPGGTHVAHNQSQRSDFSNETAHSRNDTTAEPNVDEGN